MSRAQHSHLSQAASSSFSKPLLLAGVQDAYWSDDEEENSTCPLCIKELDMEEQSFKPCPCGYQICLFCWHHIRDNINARCPACRREYTEAAVVWKPVTAEDTKRVQQQKKRKEKERRDLEQLGRKPYLDVRIVQRNVVYVVGLGPRFAKEETIAVLRSSDYFGRYGKISRIQLQKRTPPGAETPIVGVYITYLRREDAERAIQAIDGSPSPSGGGEIMRASHGTAKYCTSFLRNVTCTNNNCLDAHEWGEPEDCFTREELTTLKHTIKETEKRPSSTAKKTTEQQEAPSLPRAASWAARAVPPNSTLPTIQTIQLGPPGPRLGSSRQRQPRNVSGGKAPVIEIREKDKRRPTTANTSSNSVTSPPQQHAPKPPSLSTIAIVAAQDTASNVSSPQLTSSVAESDSLASPVPRNVETLSAPPGLKPATVVPAPVPAPSAPTEAPTTTTTAPTNPPPGLVRPPPGLNLQTSAKPYHLSKQAQALIDDVRSRREAVVATPPPIFPDFDRTLSLLVNSAGFSFSFAGIAPQSPETAIPAGRSTRKSTFDPFSSPLERPSTSESSSSATHSVDPRRSSSFSPFGDNPLGDGTGRSRFDFARRQSSLGNHHNSRGSSPFRTESLSSTIYTSSDMGPSSRSQGSWMGYQPIGLSRDYRHIEGTGGQFSSALTMPPSEHAYNELPPTPFDQMPIMDNMREIVRGFETPAVEMPNRLDTQSSLSQQRGSQQHPANRQPVIYQQIHHVDPQTARNQGPINILSHRQSRDELSHPITSPSIEAPPMFSPYQQYQQAPTMSSTAAHVNAQASAPTKDLTSPTVNSSNAVMAIPAPIAFFQAAAAAAASAVPVTAGSSPQVSLIPSDDTEDFPALPSAVVESFATRTPSSQPPTIPKPHPAPPVTRKVTALPKPTKAETKKPALTPLTTNIDTKSAQNDEAGQPSAIEVVSAISVKAENKGKKVVHELISVVSVASTPVTASPSTQSRTVTKPAKKAERVEKIEHPKSPTHSTSSKGVSATKAPANKGAASTPSAPTQPPAPASALIEVIEHAPIVARQTKKSKPQQLPKKKPAAKPEEPATKETTTTSEPQTTPTAPVEPSVAVAAPNPSNPTSLEGLLGQLQDQLGVHSMRFFSDRCLKSQEIVEYKPLIEALSTLARDPHSQIASSNNSSNVSIASTTIDNAMASFQQLLITLTQTVSDLLHLVPPSTWSDNGAFEEVIQEMLNYNFQDSENPSKELRNAVSKLEELHHDINSASTRAVLTVNDRGWDCASFLPRAGNTAAAYEMLGKYVTGGEVKTMDVVQLEKQLALAEKEVQTTSDELQRAMAINASLLA